MKNKKRFRLWILFLTGLLVFIYFITEALKGHYEIAFNKTNSIDGFVFLVDKKADYKVEDIVVFHPPKKTGYNMGFIKYVKGVAGDEIKKHGKDIYINNVFVAHTKEKNTKNEPLFAIESQKIKSGYFFAWTPHPDSYDSRYKAVGVISDSSVVGVAYKLF